MNEKLTDERISAYLDDELSAEERADIERQLAESAELRLAVEELRALHAGMQSLPRYKLESSIADRVLQLAEREVLVGGRAESGDRDQGTASANGQSPSAADHRPQPASLHSPALPSQQESVRHEAWFSWRNLVWSASAAAVAALVTNYYHVTNPTYSSVSPSGTVAAGDPEQSRETSEAKQQAERSDSRPTKDRTDAGFAGVKQESANIESASLEAANLEPAELQSNATGTPNVP
jgi:hypothetical protein